MMSWLQTIDTALFRFINQSLTNPVFDWLMPKLAGHSLFAPVLVLMEVLLLWKGGRRGRLLAVFLALVVIGGDTLVCKNLKQAIARPRPFLSLQDATVRVGRGPSYAMPSSHAANWFAAAMVCFIFYRRSWRFMLPAAAAVAFSRVYDGVHYPADVLVGAVVGAGYAAGAVWSADALWRWVGSKWFPLWWRKLPSLMRPEETAGGEPSAAAMEPTDARVLNAHWLRLGYLLIAGLTLFRLGYIASGKINLSGDEAYQWIWSKHLALSYYSKPFMIALAQWAGTHLWGDTELGVRFFSPVAGGVVMVLVLRLFAREVSARAGVWFLLITSVTPLLVVGSTLLTIDPLLVVFWTAAMVAGWRAVQPDSTTRHWLWFGLWAGLGFLSKYNALFLWLCLGIFMALWRPAREQLRRPGVYLALLVNLACTAPVIIWNAQHQWATISHVAYNAGVEKGWKFNPGHTLELLLVTAALMTPIFFVAAVWATAAFWKKLRGQALPIYLFSMGAPVFLLHLVYTLHSRVLPNWIAPALVPSLCLMVVYWDARWRSGAPAVPRWLLAGLIFGLVVQMFALNPDLTRKVAGFRVSRQMDPLRRVQGWPLAAATVEEQRRRLAAEGKPAFVLCSEYRLASYFAFYTPGLKATVNREPLVFPLLGDVPQNQFYFWPEYRYHQTRAGQNAIYVIEVFPDELPALKRPFGEALRQRLRVALGLVEPQHTPKPAPPRIVSAFESVKSLGLFPLSNNGRVTRCLQLWECRNLKASPAPIPETQPAPKP